MNFTEQSKFAQCFVKARAPQSGQFEHPGEPGGVIGLDDVDQFNQFAILFHRQSGLLTPLRKVVMALAKFRWQLTGDFPAELIFVLGKASQRIFHRALLFDHRQQCRLLIHTGAGRGLPEP